jgi:lipoprotein-anchoring transpeptidase ErfK/SrfK
LTKIAIGFLLFCSITFNYCFSQKVNSNDIFLGEIIQDYLSSNYPDESFINYIYIGINRQRLYYFKDGQLSNIYEVSTAKKGAGNSYSSNQTPVGLHFIKKKIGDNAPIGTLFKNKKSTGKIVEIHKNEISDAQDQITSRVLVLSGKEQGLNKGKNLDTFSRRIYIHGTSDEASIGYAKSHGCIRMRNTDIVNIFDLVNESMLVILIDN